MDLLLSLFTVGVDAVCSNNWTFVAIISPTSEVTFRTRSQFASQAQGSVSALLPQEVVGLR